MSEELVAVAARNNAQWCDLVCRGHGFPGHFDTGFWTNQRHDLKYYPNMVTLSPRTSVKDVIEGLGDSPAGATVKDSFACLDLGPAGYGLLLEATWIHRPARRPNRPPAGSMTWEEITSAERLGDWQFAWAGEKTDVFRPHLLESPECKVIAGCTAGRVVAGAMLNFSTQAVGVSNVFCGDRDPGEVWEAVLDTAALIAPGRPVVGYERGEALHAAIRNGCQPAGPVRVWKRGSRQDRGRAG